MVGLQCFISSFGRVFKTAAIEIWWMHADTFWHDIHIDKKKREKKRIKIKRIEKKKKKYESSKKEYEVSDVYVVTSLDQYSQSPINTH